MACYRILNCLLTAVVQMLGFGSQETDAGDATAIEQRAAELN